jgi:hypothetical protein
MPTSWNNTAQIDQYLHKKMSTGNTLVFEAKLILQPELADDMHWQQKTYGLVQIIVASSLREKLM